MAAGARGGLGYASLGEQHVAPVVMAMWRPGLVSFLGVRPVDSLSEPRAELERTQRGSAESSRFSKGRESLASCCSRAKGLETGNIVGEAPLISRASHLSWPWISDY